MKRCLNGDTNIFQHELCKSDENEQTTKKAKNILHNTTYKTKANKKHYKITRVIVNNEKQ